MAKLVQRDGGKWSVRMVVPPSLRHIVKKTQLWQSCRTKDKRLAEERSHAIIIRLTAIIKSAERQAAREPRAPGNALLQNVIENARQLLTAPPTVGLSADSMDTLAKAGKLPFGVEPDDGHANEDETRTRFAEIIEQYIIDRGLAPDYVPKDELEAQARALRGNPDEDIPEDDLTAIRGLSRMVTPAGDSMPLSEAVERHLNEKRGRINQSTLLRKQIILDDFAAFSKNPLVADVGRADAGRYVSEVLLAADVSVSTKKWRIGALSAAWAFFERKGFCKTNIWKGLTADINGSTRGKPKLVKRAWTQSEIDQLKTLPDGNVIKIVSIIRLHSGCRTEEICCLTTGSVDLEAKTIQIGTDNDRTKTQSSVRLLPMHPVLEPILARLVADAGPSGYLFDMKRRGQDKVRSHNFGKVAGRWLRENVTKDPTCSFYTLRHTYAAAMRDLGIDRDLIAWTTGHKDQTTLFATYAPEIAIERLREAVSRLDFGFTI